MLTESPAYSVLFITSLLSCSSQGEPFATPLMAASGINHIEVARFLVEHGASINYQNQVFDNHFLLNFSNLLIIPLSCIPSQYGYSALQVACNSGSTDMVKLLIQSNANIELKNKVGFVLVIIHHSLLL